MDYSKRGGFKKSLLLLLIACLTNRQSQYVEATTDDEFSTLIKNQGYFDSSTYPRTKFISSLSNLLQQDEDGKRSSSFFPLRGKKMPNIEPNIVDHYQFMPESEDKRSQFFPLRGKKIPSDLKRASYFMPMRGRKSGDELEDLSNEEDSQDKRASSFMPMRGKKQSDGASNTFQHYGKSALKRPMSFFATRGKRSDGSWTKRSSDMD